ncbi:MAG: TRAP transporter substrate-binding protein [Treponema sp.]|nr:TRAP transporter substrate-binding protein [Treponema sp.]
MKRVFVIFLAFFFAFPLLTGCTGSGAADGSVNIKIAHVSQEGVPIDRAARRLGELLYAQTDGRITVDVFPASILGGNRELLEQLQFGTLEMVIPSVAFLGGFTDATGLLDLPYLFVSDSAAEEVLDGEVGQAIFSRLADAGFVGLAWFSTGWRHLTANEIVRTPADMRGKRIRVMENQMHIDHFNAIGASAIPMAFSEVFTALQNRTIDSQENPYANIQGNRLNEVQRYIIETGHVYDTAPLLASRIWWDRLSAEDQILIRDNVAYILGWQRMISLEDQDEIRQAFNDNGFNTVVQLTPEERAAFRVAAQPVFDTHGPRIGLDLIEMVEEVNRRHIQ